MEVIARLGQIQPRVGELRVRRHRPLQHIDRVLGFVALQLQRAKVVQRLGVGWPQQQRFVQELLSAGQIFVFQRFDGLIARRDKALFRVIARWKDRERGDEKQGQSAQEHRHPPEMTEVRTSSGA